jgi:Integrase core domain
LHGFNPHSFRHALAALGERTCRNPEEFKAWSQNLGHEDVLTTFSSYGPVSEQRQAELIKYLALRPTSPDAASALAEAAIGVLRQLFVLAPFGKGPWKLVGPPWRGTVQTKYWSDVAPDWSHNSDGTGGTHNGMGSAWPAAPLICGPKPIAPASPWQNGIAERLIGSIRRECVDHIIVLGEVHLRQILQSYARYYNDIRTHRSLDKDAPVSRQIQRMGSIKSYAILGGLHHHYARA